MNGAIKPCAGDGAQGDTWNEPHRVIVDAYRWLIVANWLGQHGTGEQGSAGIMRSARDPNVANDKLFGYTVIPWTATLL